MIVGTAGHVDHGKSALVQALTGVDPDRLAEEKRRGISIDLGFAYMPMEDGGVLGFVDVPGHEHFIRNMLAGATGIDFVLLTVAADDGVMPQTVEHLAIVDLLGLTRGIVALTKCDLVPPERRAEVTAEIGKLLVGTGLDRAAIVETSIVTGIGVETIRNLLVSAAENTASITEKYRFRMPVDRCFTLRGVGTIVTGTVLSGAVSVGDQVMVSPSGLTARVRSIHAQNQAAERGLAGQRCALNLAGDGIAKDAIARGDMVLDPSLHAPTARIDSRLRVLASETKPISLWLPARLHHGAAEVGARVVPLDAAPLRPGHDGWVQLVLDRPIAAAVGDRFVLRDTSAQRTIGGGRFVDLRAPARKRRTSERLTQLSAMLADDAVMLLLDLPPYFLDLTAFRRDRALPDPLDETAEQVRFTIDGRLIALSASHWERLTQSVATALAQFHDAHSDAPGMPPDALRRAAEPRLPAPIFAASLDELARRQIVVLDSGLAHLPRHRSRLAPAQEALWRKIEPLLDGKARFGPPRLADLAKTVGAGDGEVRNLLKLVARIGLAEEVALDHFFRHAAIVEAAGIVRHIAETAPDGWFGAAQLRDRLDTGRKNAIELLEYFDRRGLTMRRGDLRRIDARKLNLFR